MRVLMLERIANIRGILSLRILPIFKGRIIWLYRGDTVVFVIERFVVNLNAIEVMILRFRVGQLFGACDDDIERLAFIRL